MDEIIILKTKLEIQSRQINDLIVIKHKYIKLTEEYEKVKNELDRLKNDN